MTTERGSRRDMTLLKELLGQSSASSIQASDEMDARHRQGRSSRVSRNSESSCISDSQSHSETHSLASTLTKPARNSRRTSMAKSPRRKTVQSNAPQRSCWTAVQEPIMSRLEEKYRELREILETQFLEHKEQLNREILAQARRDVTRFKKMQGGLKDMPRSEPATAKQRARRRRRLEEDVARESFSKVTQTQVAESEKSSVSSRESVPKRESEYADIITIDATGNDPVDSGSIKHVTFVAPAYVSKEDQEVEGPKRRSRMRNGKQRNVSMTESQRPKSSRGRQDDQSSVNERIRKVLRDASLDDSTTLSSSSPSPSRSLEVASDGGTYRWSNSADGRVQAWLQGKRELQSRARQQKRQEKRKKKQAAHAAQMEKDEREELSRQTVDSWMRQKAMDARLLQRERRRNRMTLCSPRCVTCPVQERVVGANMHPASGRVTTHSDFTRPISARPRPSSPEQPHLAPVGLHQQSIRPRPQSGKPFPQSGKPRPQSAKLLPQNVAPCKQFAKPIPHPHPHPQTVRPPPPNAATLAENLGSTDPCICGFADAESSSQVWLSGETTAISKRAMISDRKIVPPKHLSKSPTRSSKVENATAKTDTENRLSYDGWLKNKKCDDRKKRKNTLAKSKEGTIDNQYEVQQRGDAKDVPNSNLSKSVSMEVDSLDTNMEVKSETTMRKKTACRKVKTVPKTDGLMSMMSRNVAFTNEAERNIVTDVEFMERQKGLVSERRQKETEPRKVRKQQAAKDVTQNPPTQTRVSQRATRQKTNLNNASLETIAHATKTTMSSPPKVAPRRRQFARPHSESWNMFAGHIWQKLNEEENGGKGDSEEERPEPQGSDQPDKSSPLLIVCEGHPRGAILDESANKNDEDVSTSEDDDDDDDASSGVSSSEVTPLDGQSLDDVMWPGAAIDEAEDTAQEPETDPITDAMPEIDPIRSEVYETYDPPETIQIVVQKAEDSSKEDIPIDESTNDVGKSDDNCYVGNAEKNDERHFGLVNSESVDVLPVTENKVTEIATKDADNSAIFLTENED